MPEWIGPRLRFKCLLCGECCRLYWVPLTHKDLARIYEKTGLPPQKFAAAVPKDAVGDWGLPAFYLSERREHYLALRKRVDGFCFFVKLQGGRFVCSIYDVRPLTCRFYPYVYVPDRVVRFELLEEARTFCPGVGRGPVYELSREAEAALAREAEMEEYKSIVAAWNALVLFDGVEPTFERFLEFLLERARRL
ncbi:MAG: YkgJ family cysteine cluster protein [Thermoproteus sp.]